MFGLLRAALTGLWDTRVQVQTSCPTEHHGSDYGGWTICPIGLDESSIVYSLGVGDDITFDLSLIEQYGLTVYAFDATPRSVHWAKGQQFPERFRFYEFAVLDHDGAATFYPPENSTWMSYTVWSNQYPTAGRGAATVATRRLGSLMAELGHDRIDLLKMDIEGSEYPVIDDMLRSGLDVRQLLVEFHHRLRALGRLAHGTL